MLSFFLIFIFFKSSAACCLAASCCLSDKSSSPFVCIKHCADKKMMSCYDPIVQFTQCSQRIRWHLGFVLYPGLTLIELSYLICLVWCGYSWDMAFQLGVQAVYITVQLPVNGPKRSHNATCEPELFRTLTM